MVAQEATRPSPVQMADIFISYAAADRERARALAQALGGRGWSVWWDRDIPFGEPFDRVIERELAGARAVIVLWSKVSVDSDWVRNEARRGLKRDALIPVQIDAVDLPLEFSNVQTADLVGWRSGEAGPAFDKLVERLGEVVGRPGEERAPPAAPASGAGAPSGTQVGERGAARRAIGWIAAAVALLAIGGGAAYWWLAMRGEADLVVVPDVGGLDRASAESALRRVGLRAGRLTLAGIRTDASVTVRSVRSQTPRAGARVALGTAVDLVMAEPGVQVPKLVRMDLKRAGAVLGEAGLAMGDVAQRAGTGASPGLVIEQKKPAGTWVVRGSSIDLVAAAAEDAGTVRMPDLRGMQIKDAYRALQKDGFEKPQILAVAADGERPDTVLDQDPPPGNPVSRDVAVKLRVARSMRAVEAGGPLDAQTAKTRCPAVCAAADGKWTGQWRKTAQGQSATCQCTF